MRKNNVLFAAMYRALILGLIGFVFSNVAAGADVKPAEQALSPGTVSEASEAVSRGLNAAASIVNIDIQVLTVWNTGCGESQGIASGNSAGNLVKLWWEDNGEVDPDGRISRSFFTNETGYYNYVGPVNCEGYRVSFYFSNAVSRIFTITDDDTIEVNESTVLFVPDQDCMEDRDITFDWYTSEVLSADPSYLGELTVARHLKEMNDWYESWLGERYNLSRIDTYCRSLGRTLGNFVSIEIEEKYLTCDTVILHEFAHVVMSQNSTSKIDRFLQEGQAQYFTGSFFDAPHYYGAGSIFEDNYLSGKDDKFPRLNDPSHYGDVLNHVMFGLREAYEDKFVDSMVFFSVAEGGNAHSISEVMRDVLVFDDDNGNLADGTPNFQVLVEHFADASVGPNLPTVFFVNGMNHKRGAEQIWGPVQRQHEIKILSGDRIHKFATLDTYPMDSLVWDFGDQTARVVQSSRSTVSDTLSHKGFPWVEHTFDLCGSFNVVCNSFHPWGSRKDTLHVSVTSPDSCGNYICGDVNHNGFISISDLTYLYAYIFNSGPAPIPMASGELNGDGRITVSDFLVLTNYFYGRGSLNCNGRSLSRAPALTEEDRALIEELSANIRNDLPGAYSLENNFPNPFNPATMISYAMPLSGHVNLVIYNAIGQRVRSLVDGPQAAGEHQVQWDGRDDEGRTVSSGIYLYRLTAGEFSSSKKMILLK